MTPVMTNDGCLPDGAMARLRANKIKPDVKVWVRTFDGGKMPDMAWRIGVRESIAARPVERLVASKTGTVFDVSGKSLRTVQVWIEPRR